VRGARIDLPRNARSERDGLRACGVPIHVLRDEHDREGLEALKKLLFQTDRHVVLARLLPKELHVLQPLLRERRNFSIVLDDWWSSPYWFTRHAEYILFRNYNGLAVRRGLCPLAPVRLVPWFTVPEKWSLYATAGMVLRPAALLVAPFLAAWNWWSRHIESIPHERLIYFPFPVAAADVPLGKETVDLDFSNLGGTYGIWVMRDPHASPLLNFTNLYYDRKLIADALARFDGNPYCVFDWRRSLGTAAARNPLVLSFEQYGTIARRSRYTVACGGLHQTSVPKFLEFACLGVPMIGRPLPYEYPWLQDCLFPVEPFGQTDAALRRSLDQALELHLRYRENCMNWRDRLLRDYHIERLLAVAQDQIDGKPIPPGYLTGAATVCSTHA
jgi:hypothetical protein